MRLSVNPSGELPVYRQLMRQLVDAIAGGQLKAGDRLPSHRELAQELVIAPLTVKKAYDELERAGYILMRRGSGTFVAERPPEFTEADKLARLQPLVRQLVVQAALLGVSPTRVAKLVKEQAEEQRAAAKARGSSAEKGTS